MVPFNLKVQTLLMKLSVTYAQSQLNTPVGMSVEELQETCVSLVAGGSETTATLLSGVVYYILKNQRILGHLVKEIRTAFPTEDEINMSSVRDLEYEPAVLQEALRIFPPGK
jgi:cytochrome P450